MTRLVTFPEFGIGPLVFGSRYISAYGVTFALAVLAVALLALREARRRGISKRRVAELLGLSFLTGLAGARLAYVAFFFHGTLAERIVIFFSIGKSGLASFGAFAGVILAAVLYRHLKRVNIWKLLDVCSVGLMLGLAIGRVGCFLAPCCYGIKAELPWAVFQKGALRHPTQIYDMLGALITFAVISRVKYLRTFDGALFLLNIILYSFFRIIVEFFRVGPGIFGVSYNQILYGGLLLAALVLYYKKS